MNDEAITFMNWMGLFLMIPGGIAIVWQVLNDQRRNKKLTTNSITSIVLFLAAVLSLAQLNMKSDGWLRWSMLLIQCVVIIVLFKLTWSPFVRKLRGLE
jgi:hypothetical protein